LKLIEMKAGAKGGLQYHRRKDEAGVMVRGEMAITYDDGTGCLVVRNVVPGDVFHFPTGSVHQAKAITECAIH
jgi:quercetin dioxygenase-like cupin family protein